MWNSRLLYELRNKYSALSPREKWIVSLGMLVVLVFVYIQFVIFPINQKKQQRQRAIEIKENELVRLKTLTAQYKTIMNEGNRRGIGIGDDSFNLFSFLEDIATKSGLMDSIDYMRPGDMQLDHARTEKWVEIKLSNITLKEFTIYLYNLQSLNDNIYIKRLSARKDGDYVNLILQPAVIELK